MRLTLIAACLVLPVAAQADCVTLYDMTHMPGATLTTQQGSVEIGRWGTTDHTMREGKAIYQDKAGKTDHWRVFRGGVFETEEYWNYEDPKTGALMLVDLQRKFSGRLPKIEPGKSWETMATDRISVHNKLTGEDTKTTEKLTVTYSFLPAKQVKISGCSYETIPVEATLAGDQTRLTRRFIYFPALEAGIVTREQDHVKGTEVKNGITGMASWKELHP
ncbi:hypothetical protein L0V05_06500 [Tabrizicola sp. J26]|uniref:hypothetical protein n=1 Tax=Alitabrizicola rongguiensis TaxID=2909234 RepID=UPI001F2CE99E|nr:hypothetical protein [Tabrizicola rongguiensis]MCF1708463.1 hypothetical protein [Tabrizicola rongguiensis]